MESTEKAPSNSRVPRRIGFGTVIAVALFSATRGFAAVSASPSWVTGMAWFLFCTALLIAAVWLWEYTERRHWVIRSGLSAFAAGLIFLLGYGPVRDQYRREHSIVTNPTKPTNPLVLEADAKLWPGLPINIAPRQRMHFITFSDDLISETRTMINSSDVGMLWPNKLKASVPQPVSVYEISNHDSISVFNLIIELQIRFYKTFPEELVKQEMRNIVIESLKPGDSFDFYLVNESRYWINVPLPTSAELQVQGSTAKVKVDLVPHGALSEVPVSGSERLTMPIEPSLRKWKDSQILEESR